MMTGLRERIPTVLAVVGLVTLVALASAPAAASPTATGGDARVDGTTATAHPIAVPEVTDGATVPSGVASDLTELTEETAAIASDLPAEAPTAPVVAVAGYSRWDDSDPLSHETRQALFDEVSAAPGASLSAVADRLAAARSTVRYHYRILEAEGLVDGRKVRGRRVLFPADGRPTASADASDGHALAAALEDDVRRDVVLTVHRTEPVSVSDLASELDLARSTVSHHLQRLAADGLVDREREGRAVLSSLTRSARSAVERSTES